MRSSIRVPVLLVGAILLASETYAGGFQLNEAGARGMSQAGAFAARAYDGSAIYYNPAGLGFQNQGSVYFGATAIIPKSSFYGPIEENTNQKTEAPSQFFNPINAYVTYPVMDRLHVGIGVNNPYGLGSKWPSDWVGRYLTTNVQLKTFYFSPTVAYRLTDDLSIGAGFNYVTGNVVINRAVMAGIDDPTVGITLSGTGVGFNAGILYKFSPDVSIGLSYRSQVKVNADGTATFVPNYSALPGGDASSSITLPSTGFFGIACKPMTNLEVEADVQYIGWSSFDKLSIDFNKTGLTSTVPKNYKNTYILRLGGEYTIGDFHLRGGYLYDHSPVEDAYVDPMLPDASRHGINLGLGYDVTKDLSVDVSYLFEKFFDRTITNSIPEVSFNGTYHTRINLIGLNIGVKI